MPQTVYERYGGFSTVNRLVSNFYDKVLASRSLSKFFENVDMERLVDHQTKFLCQVLGGPEDYTGRELREAHHHLNISFDDFEEVATLLKETLEEGGVQSADVTTVLGIVAETRGDIVA